MGEQKYILVVDDEPVSSALLESLLKTNGYEVGVFPNGRVALGKINVRVPDLIISDVLMPEMDGFTFFKEMKKNPALASTPMIILTAREKMQDTFAVLGVDEFLVKPFASEDLLQKVQALLARGKTSALPVDKISGLTHDQVKAPLPMGLVVGVAFGLLMLVLSFVIFQQVTKAQKQAIQIGESLKKEDAAVAPGSASVP